MEKIKWRDSYLLGITEIDNEHKKLLNIANDLFDVVNGAENNATFKVKFSPVLKKLTDYTEYHFEDEEKFLRRYEYPGMMAHKAAHDSFIKEVNAQIRKLISATPEDGLRMYHFMVQWILTHIAKADAVWAKYVKEKM